MAEHRALHHELLGETWAPPVAYRWMRYESPDPVGALRRASARLESEWRDARTAPGWACVRRRWRAADAAGMAAALTVARRLGYPS